MSSCSTTAGEGSTSSAPSSTTAALPNGLTPIGQPPGPVPSQYQTEYSIVRSEVESFARQSRAVPVHPSTTIGTELLAANGNIGDRLLGPGGISGVESELDALGALGVGGVTVDVSFPLLLPSTPRSSQFLTFYEEVAQQVRDRHMVLSVEENPVFSGTPLTPLQISYAGLTLASYASEQQAQAQIIIEDLHPQYLTILTEPDTFTATLGIALDSASAAVQVVNDELNGLRRNGTEVGAGTGTWSDPSIDDALLAQTSIDYLDVHVYPLGPTAVSNLETDVAEARAVHKPLVMDETWLNKPAPGQVSGPQGAPAELKLKSYSFWEPLDEQFVASMTTYARAQGFAFVSFFDGARAFFGYLTWSPALESESYQQTEQLYDQLVSANMRAGRISDTGVALVRAVRQG